MLVAVKARPAKAAVVVGVANFQSSRKPGQNFSVRVCLLQTSQPEMNTEEQPSFLRNYSGAAVSPTMEHNLNRYIPLSKEEEPGKKGYHLVRLR